MQNKDKFIIDVVADKLDRVFIPCIQQEVMKALSDYRDNIKTAESLSTALGKKVVTPVLKLDFKFSRDNLLDHLSKELSNYEHNTTI